MKKVRGRKVTAVETTKSIVARVKKMSAHEPIRPCKGSLIDYIIDMYDMPDQIELRHVYSGSAGARQDAINMRSYFGAARREMPTKG